MVLVSAANEAHVLTAGRNTCADPAISVLGYSFLQYSDVTWATWRLVSPTTRLFVQQLATQTKGQQCTATLWWESTLHLTIIKSRGKHFPVIWSCLVIMHEWWPRKEYYHMSTSNMAPHSGWKNWAIHACRLMCTYNVNLLFARVRWMHDKPHIVHEVYILI